MEILDDNSNFTLIPDVHGPLLAVAVGIECAFAFIINLFLLVFTLCHPKELQEPSVMFLTNFVFANLLLTVIFMPSIIVNAAAREWVFGRTPEEKNGTCQLVGFLLYYYGFQTLLTLAVISVDRFLFIVEPFIHKRFMKTWVALIILICVWILSCLINIPPYFQVNRMGKYAFVPEIASCGLLWRGQRYYLIYFCTLTSTVIMIILITTVWTFCFTRRLIYNIRQQHSTNSEDRQNHLYVRRIKKLVGVFGMLLAGTILTFLPGILVGGVEAAVGHHKIPAAVFSTVFVLFLLNSVLNPIIQSYFRRDVYDFLATKVLKTKSMFIYTCGQLEINLR